MTDPRGLTVAALIVGAWFGFTAFLGAFEGHFFASSLFLVAGWRLFRWGWRRL